MTAQITASFGNSQYFFERGTFAAERRIPFARKRLRSTATDRDAAVVYFCVYIYIFVLALTKKVFIMCRCTGFIQIATA
jgi:hypothetical protein